MTVSGYRLPQQIPGQSMSQQQPQDGNGVISKTELNRSDSTIGISSETAAATPTPATTCYSVHSSQTRSLLTAQRDLKTTMTDSVLTIVDTGGQEQAQTSLAHVILL